MRTEDGSIIHQCLNGEPAAFGILVEKYKAGIYAFAYDKLRNFEDAQDVTQEVFLRAYRNLRNLRRWECFAFWLYRIALNQCRRWFQARSRRPDGEFMEDQNPKILEKPSLDAYRNRQMDESLWGSLDSLSETYREVLILHYFGGMTSSEIARALGTSPGAIRVRLSRARAQLKEEMIAMMDTAFEGQRLQASFTFRIVEAVKRIKIQPMPRATGLPWGLSLAAGIMLVAMTIGSQMGIRQQSEPLVLSREMTVPEVREMAVDILGAPGTSGMSGRQGNTDGGGMDPRNPQNSFLLAPGKGGGTWTRKADMPTARYIPGSAVVDGKIYVIGGAPFQAGGMTNAVEEYDPATDTWTRRVDMPTARQGVCAAAVDGIIYAIGGMGDIDLATGIGWFVPTVEAYDPAADIWTTKTDMPKERSSSAIAVVDGIIYVIGGYGDANEILSVVEAYDPATDTWTRKADMPTARYSHAACVVDKRIYVSGGRTSRAAESCMPTLEVYDPATDTWTQSPDMPKARGGHTASVVDGRMYIIGGFRGLPGGIGEVAYMSPVVDVYDPGTDTWTTAADLPTPRWHLTSSVVDGKIYSIGGSVGEEAAQPIRFPVSTVEEFDPSLSGNIAITSPAGKLLRTWGEVKSE